MGGVDKAGMLCLLYSTSRKPKKWWIAFFFGLVDRTICNAYVVYKKMSNENINLLNFRRSVAQSMIIKGKPPNLGRPMTSSPSNRLTTNKRRKSNYSVAPSIRKENLGHSTMENEDGAKSVQKRRLKPGHFSSVALVKFSYV